MTVLLKVLVFIGTIILASFFVGGVPVKRQKNNLKVSCDDAYTDINGQTICLHSNPEIIGSGVTDDEKRKIVAIHNKIRSDVKPPAANMQKMKWDDKLASIAQLWADQCLHEPDFLTNYADYGEIMGQNIATGMNSWYEALNSWAIESMRYVYGAHPAEYLGDFGWMKVRHYAMMVSSHAVLVGCGYAACRFGDREKFYVCNYIRGYGPDASDSSWMAYPYETGVPCAACPGVCDMSLCDCGGRYCYHDGHLNLTTCQCRCESRHMGNECTTSVCAEPDSDSCWGDWSQNDCPFYPAAQRNCPHMCGVCDEPTKSPMGFNGQSSSDNEAREDIYITGMPKNDMYVSGQPKNDMYISGQPKNDMYVSGQPKNDMYVSHEQSNFLAHDDGQPMATPSHGNSTVRCADGSNKAPDVVCAAMGMQGKDTPECLTRGGAFTCNHCPIPAVKFLHCPVMCGICD